MGAKIIFFVAIICSIILIVMGFTGLLHPAAGALGWAVVLFRQIVDFVGMMEKEKEKKNKIETF